jgi:hypothetical protein
VPVYTKKLMEYIVTAKFLISISKTQIFLKVCLELVTNMTRSVRKDATGPMEIKVGVGQNGFVCVA